MLNATSFFMEIVSGNARDPIRGNWEEFKNLARAIAISCSRGIIILFTEWFVWERSFECKRLFSPCVAGGYGLK
jgi:hypothetical protein